MICERCQGPISARARFCGSCGALLGQAVLAAPLAPGDRLGAEGRYRIVRQLGQGGFGYAFEAHDSSLRRSCVVKQLRFSPGWGEGVTRRVVQAFAREARTLVALNAPGHPHIPEIYDFLPDRLCLVMKQIDGETLTQRIKRRADPLDQATALEYVRAACSALAYMHRSQPAPILHRDLKPQNLMLDSAGRVWVIDFGLARGALTGVPAVADGRSGGIGTLGYSPPEQWAGRAEPRSDIYALMATLYELLTNRRPPPEGGPDLALLPAGVHPAVGALIRRGMAPDVAARPSAAALLEAIDGVLAALHIPPPPPPAQPPPVGEAVGRRAEVAAAAALLARGGQVWISGMPGVGKTTVAALLAAAEGGPLIWLQAYGATDAEGLLWALAEFAAYHGAPALWQQIQHARRDGAPPPPITSLAAELARALRQCGGTICVDDAHRCLDDPGAELILQRLAELAGEGSLRLICTARALPAWAAGPTRLALDGLDLADSALLCARRGLTLEPGLLEALHSATEGNGQLLTLACDLLARAAAPQGLIAELAGAADVEEYLLQEVDAQLSPAARAVMEAVAALLGYGGTRAAIESLTEAGQVARELSALARRHLLTRQEGAEPRYQQHAMVQAFYYRQMRRDQRQALHRRAVAWYAGEGADPLLAARHALAAGDPAQAVDLLAADPARLIYAGQAGAMRELLGSLADAALDQGRRAALLVAQGEVATWLRESEAAREAYSAAFALLQRQDPAPAAQKLIARACEGMGALLEQDQPAEALEWVDRGVDLVAAEPSLLALLYNRRGAILIALGEYDQATAALEASLALDQQPDRLRADALNDLGVIGCIKGDFAAGQRLLEQAAELYRRLDLLAPLSAVQSNLAQIREIQGEWAAAAAEYERILKLEQQLGATAKMVLTMLQLGLLHMRRGEHGLAGAQLSQAIERSRLHGLREYQLNALASSADLAIRAGRVEAARPLLDEAAALAEGTQIRAQLPEIAWLRAQIALAGGDAAAARAQAAQAVELAGELELTIERGVALRVLGEALLASGDAQPALAALRESAELLADDPYEVARTQLALGRALRLAGDASGAALIAAARETFARLGARRDLAAAEGL